MKTTDSQASPVLAKQNIVLIGFMAVGKSVVGRRLAQKLGRPFVDLDLAIEAKEGIKVSEIFSSRGEAYFRGVEKKLLREVLSRDGQVIAAGGGAVIDGENLNLLKESSLLICLKASAEILLERAGRNDQRPLLQGKDKAKQIAELLGKRQACYAQAHMTVDTDSLSADEVVEKIIEGLKDAG